MERQEHDTTELTDEETRQLRDWAMETTILETWRMKNELNRHRGTCRKLKDELERYFRHHGACTECNP